MPISRFTQLIATACAVLAFAPAARAAGTESELLSEPLWLLQAQGLQETVWFEQGPDGLVMVACPNSSQCRKLVRTDPRGLTLSATAGTALSLVRSSADIPIFTGSASTVLMPAWVIPTSTSRIGH